MKIGRASRTAITVGMLCAMILVNGCSTIYRQMASDIFHPKDTFGWVMLPFMGTWIIVMWPIVDSVGVVQEMTDEQRQGLVDTFNESARNANAGIPGTGGYFSVPASHNPVSPPEPAPDSTATDQNASSNSDNQNSGTPAGEKQFGPSEAPLDEDEQVLMDRLQAKLDQEPAARQYFHGFFHGVNFWTRRVDLVNGSGSVDLTLELPGSHDMELFVVSTLPFAPEGSSGVVGTDDGSCIITSISVQAQAGNWRGGNSGHCVCVPGLNLMDDPSRIVNLGLKFQGLEWPEGQIHLDAYNIAQYPHRNGIVAILAVQKSN